MKGAISQLIMPASGFNWVSYLDKYGIMDDNNTEVIFYDYNPNALYYMQQTIEKFEGGDYHKFLKSVNGYENIHSKLFYNYWLKNFSKKDKKRIFK